MNEINLEKPDGLRVNTPVGKGLIVGHIYRYKLEYVVSLDERPIAVFDTDKNPLLVWSFKPEDLEVLKDEK